MKETICNRFVLYVEKAKYLRVLKMRLKIDEAFLWISGMQLTGASIDVQVFLDDRQRSIIHRSNQSFSLVFQRLRIQSCG